MADTASTNPCAFIEDAKAILDAAEEGRKEKARIQGEIRQGEKALLAIEKSISDNVSNTLRKEKEKIAVGFDEQLGVCQNKLKECRAERAKARADAVAERIQKENAALEHENSELEQQVEELYEQNRVRSFFKKHALVVLYFPKRLQDWLMVAGIVAVALFLIPLMLIFAMPGAPFGLAATLCAYLCLIFGVYLYVLHRYMMPHQHVHLQVEDIKARMKENTRKMNAVAANIRKSQDETGYQLGIYDDRIAEIEGQMKEILAGRRSALEEFEKVTRARITEEVTAANADQRDEMRRQQEERQQQLDNAATCLEQIETEIRDVYEARLGKDLMHGQKLSGLAAFCRENQELSLDQAVDCYRKTKK